MLVLALDTSTPVITAGVVRTSAHAAPTVLAERTAVDPLAHAERLIPLIKLALDEAGVTMTDLEGIVVGLGPGPFTGLRVGIATAAALGDGLGVPVHGVGSHDAAAVAALLLGTGHGRLGGPFLVVTDARRREVYLSAYDRAGVRLGGPLVLAPDRVAETLVGLGIEAETRIGAGAALLDGHVPLPAGPVGGALSAGLAAAAAATATATDQWSAAPPPLTPLYLRRPDATEPAARRPSTLQPVAPSGGISPPRAAQPASAP